MNSLEYRRGAAERAVNADRASRELREAERSAASSTTTKKTTTSAKKTTKK
jgi:hypothetical protein